MGDSSDSEPTAHRIDSRPHPGASTDTAYVEAIPDPDSETVTFVSRRPEDGETTTAWITVEADLVVNGADMQ
jgi:hypothetical protein